MLFALNSSQDGVGHCPLFLSSSPNDMWTLSHIWSTAANWWWWRFHRARRANENTGLPGDNRKIRVCENPRFQSGNMLGPIEVFKQIDCLTALEGCSSTNCKKKTWLLDSLYKWSGWEKNMLQMTQFILGRVTHFFLGHLWSITNWNGCNFMGNWSLAAKQVSN